MRPLTEVSQDIPDKHLLTVSPSAERQPGADMVWTKSTPRGPGEQQMLCQLCSEQKFLKGQEGYQLQPYLDGVTPHVSPTTDSHLFTAWQLQRHGQQ